MAAHDAAGTARCDLPPAVLYSPVQQVCRGSLPWVGAARHRPGHLPPVLHGAEDILRREAQDTGIFGEIVGKYRMYPETVSANKKILPGTQKLLDKRL